MRSRLLLNIVLLAIVVGLGFIVLHTDDDERSNLLTALEPDTITSIEIKHRDRYVVLKLENGGWSMTRPIRIAANDRRIETLLQFITATSHARYHVDDVQLSRFALDDPTTTIRFDNALLEFGNTNPINRLRYVRSGDTMHLIEDNFYPLVSSQIGTLIAMNILPADAVIENIELPSISLERDASGWKANSEARTDDIRRMVESWQRAQAFGVHDYMERGHLGDVSIGYRIDDIPQQMELAITDTDPWLILARRDLEIEYHIAAESYDDLFVLDQSMPDDLKTDDLR